MIDLIVGLILVVVVALACRYIIKARSRGQKCVGCPYCDKCKSGKTCAKDTESA